MILCRGRKLGTFCAAAENSFCFLLFISFLHFKIVFVYFDATTYRTRSSIQIYTTLVVTWRSQLLGLSPHLIDYTVGYHRLRLLFILNSPASSTISVNKNPASSSAIPSTRCSGRNLSRILSNYIRKVDQYEHQS